MLANRGLYDESIDLSLHTLNHVTEVAGRGTPGYFDCQVLIVNALARQGKVSESADQYKRITEEFRHSPACYKPRFISNYNRHLADGLWIQGKIGEAVAFHQEDIKLRVKIHRWDHKEVFRSCRDIGYCYEKLLRFDNALVYYERLLEKSRGLVRNGSSMSK